ncbi:SIS domain-containing protein [Streptomyces sp. NPDC086023]|uniref:SIS domain-containing protein n=1 Tax=Streptomyces sp. NPDC086023 TaxID=3365746 RepID=UPI0037D6D7CF
MSASRIPFHQGQNDQGAALARVAARVRAALAEPAAERLLTARRPLFTGIGASYAALALPVRQLREQGVVTQRVLASEIEDGLSGFEADVLVAVSQGGRSSETLAAVRNAPAGTPRAALLNVVPAPLSQLADVTVGLGNEPDSHASTVGYTGTLVALDLIAGALTGRPERVDPWRDIASLTGEVRSRTAEMAAALRSRAAGCVAADVVAAGASRASAEEGALLLREVVRMPSAASATRNYLHGAMESAGNTLHVIVGSGRELALARSLAGAGHTTLLVTTAGADAEVSVPDLSVIRLPACAEAARVVLETVVLQELVAQLSEERGVPVDSFVFANDDTKEGGVDPGDFEVASPVTAG